MISTVQQNSTGQLNLVNPSFNRNGIPETSPLMNSMNTANIGSPTNTTPGSAEQTGDSLWDSLYNTTIRTLSLDGLELLAKSFDNLDPNHQLYAGIAKRQRKLMEYQSEFRRNLEVFCQRANLNPKLWPSCIRHVKPSPRKENSSVNTSGMDGLLGWSANKQSTPDVQKADMQTPTINESSKDSKPLKEPKIPLSPLAQPAESKQINEKETEDKKPLMEKQVTMENEKQAELNKEQDILSTEMASSSLTEEKEEISEVKKLNAGENQKESTESKSSPEKW